MLLILVLFNNDTSLIYVVEVRGIVSRERFSNEIPPSDENKEVEQLMVVVVVASSDEDPPPQPPVQVSGILGRCILCGYSSCRC